MIRTVRLFLILAALAVAAVSRADGLVEIGTRPTGGLSDKVVFIHGGHGYTANSPGNGKWSFQRSESVVGGTPTEMIEDLGNVDQMTFLADYLFRAGATVVAQRPIGHQTNEVVLDNDDAGVTFSGKWLDGKEGVFFGDKGDVPYTYAATSPNETAYARFKPNFPEAGFYPVYAWTTYGANRATDQLYCVTHSGGATEVTLNHRRVGNGPVYLGTYYFEAGDGGYVDISNRSQDADSVVVADMIRFGNGMGDIDRGAGISGLPREDEAALYWVEWHVNRAQGVDTDEYRSRESNDRDATVGTSPRYSEYMNREADGELKDRVLVSYHSNAAGGRGVTALHNTKHGGTTPNQVLLVRKLAQEINDDMVAQNDVLEPDWHNRGTNVLYENPAFNYGELNNSHIHDEFDATIVEVAFHDQLDDAQLMREAYVRDALARATYQGLLKYFREVDGNATPAAELPLPVTGVSARSNGAGSVQVTWTPPAANEFAGGAATGYRVYASTNGYGFDGGTAVDGAEATQLTLKGFNPKTPYFFKVAAVNEGGESAGSEIMAALPSGKKKQVLVVNGFDRLERSQNPRQELPAPNNVVDRVRPRESNSRDYTVQVADAIHAADPSVRFDSASNESVLTGEVDVNDYKTIVWILGEESTANETFSADEQKFISQLLASGKNLFVSGAEIAWDLDRPEGPTGADRAFCEDTLKAKYVADDANVYSVIGVGGSIFEGLNVSFDNGPRYYDVDWPDVIKPQEGAGPAFDYANGSGSAGIQVHGSGSARIVFLGFPFETITTAEDRAAVMGRVLRFFQQ
jgi:Fibronectin type III domain